jgi:tetratricopeptide (TPR) repeat protein
MRGSAIATSVLAAVCALAVPATAQPRGDDESAALVEAGRRALKAGSLGDAGKALDQALALNPRRIEAYVLRAAVYAARGEPAKGVALMRKARELAPDNDEVAIALGAQLMLAGDTDEGVPLLEAAAARTPDRFEAHALLGHHYADHARWAAAVTELEAYARTRPASLAARGRSPRARSRRGVSAHAAREGGPRAVRRHRRAPSDLDERAARAGVVRGGGRLPRGAAAAGEPGQGADGAADGAAGRRPVRAGAGRRRRGAVAGAALPRGRAELGARARAARRGRGGAR